MKNGWIKLFHNTYITGADEDNVSWSNTPVVGLRGVIVHQDGLIIEALQGYGEYHYSEDYEVSIGSNDHKLLTRRVQFHQEDNTWLTWEIDLIKREVRKSILTEKI